MLANASSKYKAIQLSVLNTYRERQKTLCVLQKGQAGMALNCSKKGLGQTLGKAFSQLRLVRLPMEAGEFSLFAEFKIGSVASNRVRHNLFCFWDRRSIIILKKAVSISWGTSRTETIPN